MSGGGRAYCGSRLKVNEGDAVVGTMTGTGGNKWKVSASKVGSSDVSSIDVSLDKDIQINAAYCTVEGMIIYSCDAYPQGNATAFTKNKLTDSTGASVNPQWTPVVRHSECGQHVTTGPGAGDVVLHWNKN